MYKPISQGLIAHATVDVTRKVKVCLRCLDFGVVSAATAASFALLEASCRQIVAEVEAEHDYEHPSVCGEQGELVLLRPEFQTRPLRVAL